MNTDLEITLEFLDSPTEVDFFAVAGAPGHDGQDGADGADGHTPVITATKSGKTTTVSVDGNPVAQILDGADGQPGQDGQDGSPGQDGADGHSPVVTASKSGKVTTVSVDGEPIATINDGNDGQNGQDGHTPVKGTDYWTAADKAEIVAEAAEAVDLSDYVQKTDYASANDAGVVKISNNYGVYLHSTAKQIIVNKASSADIKSGTEQYKPIVPYTQHESAFYALAKAAGDSTQSASSNTVGNYTDTAKVAIQKMLGIYQAPWELIREDTFTNATEATHEITVDSNGQAFELIDAILLFETPVQATDAAKGDYGSIRFYNGSTTVAMTYSNAWTQTANSAAHGTWSMVERKDGLVFISARTQSASTNMGSMSMPYRAGFGNDSLQGIQSAENFSVTKVTIPKVTGTGHYILYGKRKWQ